MKLTLNATEVTWDEIVQYGQEKRAHADREQFEWGDLAAWVTKLFGAKKLREYSTAIKINYRTLCRYRDVANAYTQAEREQFSYLSWTHFRKVAAREDRIRLLEEAADKDWSVEKMAVMTKEDQTDVITDVEDVPHKPKLEFCRVSKKWYIPADDTCPTGCTHQEKSV